MVTKRDSGHPQASVCTCTGRHTCIHTCLPHTQEPHIDMQELWRGGVKIIHPFAHALPWLQNVCGNETTQVNCANRGIEPVSSHTLEPAAFPKLSLTDYFPGMQLYCIEHFHLLYLTPAVCEETIQITQTWALG